MLIECSTSDGVLLDDLHKQCCELTFCYWLQPRSLRLTKSCAMIRRLQCPILMILVPEQFRKSMSSCSLMGISDLQVVNAVGQVKSICFLFYFWRAMNYFQSSRGASKLPDMKGSVCKSILVNIFLDSGNTNANGSISKMPDHRMGIHESSRKMIQTSAQL